MTNVNPEIGPSQLQKLIILHMRKNNKRIPGVYIFSTGQGGQALCQHLLADYNLNKVSYCIKGFLDNNPAMHGSAVAGLPVVSPQEAAIENDDIIVIASLMYCYDMEDQLLELGVKAEQIILPGNWLTELIPSSAEPSRLNSSANKPSTEMYEKYVTDLLIRTYEKSKDFIDDDEAFKIDLCESDVKLIAFYLPQFHPIPENDCWWGRGFTEWTNVTKAVPQYIGHHQPQLPIDIGFYDLRNIQVMERQIELAQKYGIYGFCFHHYWFAGKRLLETPVNNFLKHTELNMPFCLCWANENWTRRWDGLENEVLIAQKHSKEDDLAFIADAVRYFKDKRYIRIQGRPLFIVYRPSLFPDPSATVKIWREYCQRMGVGDIFVAGVKGFGLDRDDTHGLDALVEFPPHGFFSPDISDQVLTMNPNFSGKVFDYDFCTKNKDFGQKEKCRTFRGVMPGWDNTARRPNNAAVFHGSCPEKYQKWLEDAIHFTKNILPNEQQFVFINAWNEWAEGAHLEPDRKFGYGNLRATANALLKSRK